MFITIFLRTFDCFNITITYIINHMNKGYIVVTDKWLKDQKAKLPIIQNRDVVIGSDGKTYRRSDEDVDMTFEPKKEDIEAANWWKEIKGGVIKLNPRLNMPEGIKTADLEIDGIQVEVKTLYGEGKWAIFNLFNKVKQADTYLINIANSPLSKLEIRDQIELLFKSNSRKWINMVIVRDKDELIEVYKRT